ncbi:hypothetical protein ACJX0J_039573, partial [Zea mays]
DAWGFSENFTMYMRYQRAMMNRRMCQPSGLDERPHVIDEDEMAIGLPVNKLEGRTTRKGFQIEILLCINMRPKAKSYRVWNGRFERTATMIATKTFKAYSV